MIIYHSLRADYLVLRLTYPTFSPTHKMTTPFKADEIKTAMAQMYVYRRPSNTARQLTSPAHSATSSRLHSFAYPPKFATRSTPIWDMRRMSRSPPLSDNQTTLPTILIVSLCTSSFQTCWKLANKSATKPARCYVRRSLSRYLPKTTLGIGYTRIANTNSATKSPR